MADQIKNKQTNINPILFQPFNFRYIINDIAATPKAKIEATTTGKTLKVVSSLSTTAISKKAISNFIDT